MHTSPRISRGFTLIELLVVIAIIGILASIVMVSLSGARSTSRDAQRAVHAREIKKALDMYFLETGVYPSGGPTAISGILDAPLQQYLPTLPTDPSNQQWSYISNGKEYALRVYWENSPTTLKWCKTSVTSTLGWWSTTSMCPF